MKLNLAARLFAAVLGAAVVVAVAMGVGAHLNLNRDFLGYLNEQAVNRLELAVPSVTAGYRQQGSWDFLRARPDLWYRLLRPAPDDASVPLTERAKALPTEAELTGASRRFTLLGADRQRIVGFATPAEDAVERGIVVDGVTVGWLVLTPFESVSSGAEQRFADAQARTAWIVGGGAVLLAAAVALWASRRLLRPVRQVAEATHRLAAGHHDTRVPERAVDDEIGRLAHDFNQLALTLQRNEAMRREFMADVSHELRTPLGVLHGELEAFEDGVRPLDTQAVRSLKAEVLTLHTLVDDLYELSLADVGALSYRKASLDLREIIDDTAGAFGERLRTSGLALQLELPSEPLPALGDARRLRQLFANLFENSCRYTERGGTLRLRAQREGRQMLIDLHDSAPGVRAEHLPRLFERFSAPKRRATGAPVARGWACRFANASFRRMKAASRLVRRRWAGCGCAWSCLPLDEAPLSLEPGPARVLVVEDEPKLAALLADYLRAAGHEVERVGDGRDALQAWTERRHDLVLLDLMLPGMDGLTLCRELRALTSVPIVMLTARADEADRLAGLELGADDYIPKTPFSPREVMARVKAVLRRSRAVPRPSGPLLQIDDQGWCASWQGRALDLTRNEFCLLRMLASQPGRVYARSQLLACLQGEVRAATERAVDSHVKNLRRKLEQAGAGSERIRSVYGLGYRYEATPA